MIAAAHPTTPEEVMAFVDGELGSEQSPVLSAHFEVCDECRELARNFRGLSRTIGEWKVPAVPDRVEKRVSGNAAKRRAGESVEHESLFVRLSFWTPGQWTVGLGAGAALLAAILFALTPARMRPPASIETTSKPVFEQRAPISIDNAVVARQSSPRASGDTNRMFHGRGSFDQNSFSVDGQLKSGGQGNVFSNALPTSSQAPDAITAPMIARTVSLSLVVKDFAASRANLDAILQRHHGYAAELTANTAENAPRSIQASLRVPAPQLDAAIADLKALGRVENERQSGEEVTQQHADLLARLKNSRETEQRLQAILAERTGKVKDVLEVEQEIARVRGEIEEMEAEQKSLEHRVEFATVNLNLNEEYKAQLLLPALSAGTRLHNALVEGYRNASETVLGIVVFFAQYALTLVIWGLILCGPAILLWRRFRRAMATV